MLDRLVDPILRRMLHPPRRAPRPLPDSLAARAQDVSIPADSRPVKAWLIRAEGVAIGTVVVVHGWGGDSGRMAPLAARLSASGLTTLLVDLPGHGRTGPVLSYNVKLMVDDLRAVREWVATRDELRGRPVAILGFSFGGLGAYVAASRSACDTTRIRNRSLRPRRTERSSSWECPGSSSKMALSSAKTVSASENETLCFRKFAEAFR